jgi:hypothetical protein
MNEIVKVYKNSPVRIVEKAENRGCCQGCLQHLGNQEQP